MEWLASLDGKTWWLIGLTLLVVIQVLGSFVLFMSNMFKSGDLRDAMSRLREAERRANERGPW